jgi:hypothetical protein
MLKDAVKHSQRLFVAALLLINIMMALHAANTSAAWE